MSRLSSFNVHTDYADTTQIVPFLQKETDVILTVLNAVMDGTSCYPHLNTFTCALLNPKCGADNHRLPPCRRLCIGYFSQSTLICRFDDFAVLLVVLDTFCPSKKPRLMATIGLIFYYFKCRQHQSRRQKSWL